MKKKKPKQNASAHFSEEKLGSPGHNILQN